MASYYDSTSGTDAWQTWATFSSACDDTSNTGTWPTWVGFTYTTAGDDTWQTWVSDGASTAAGKVIITCDTYEGSWNVWQDDSCIKAVPDKRSEAQRLAELEAERNRRKKAEKEAERARIAQEEAEKRAKELLEDLIGEDQLEVYTRTERLLVHGRKYDYLLTKGGGVKRIEKDKVIDLCIHLVDKFEMPDTDNVISLKLLAEADEKRFNDLANTQGSRAREELPECACMGARE